MNLHIYETDPNGLREDEIEALLRESLEGRAPKRVLIIPPDFTRYHSNAGLITRIYDRLLRERGCAVDILPALGRHTPITEEQVQAMFGDIPRSRFIDHDWRNDTKTIGVIPAETVSALSEGICEEPVEVAVNTRIVDGGYDLILSVGQVVPHEVVGMSNHSKNLFVGCGGSDIIDKSHMVGAFYGLERMMGKLETPVRHIFDYALANFLKDSPILFVMTVCTLADGVISTHGVFIGDERAALEDAVRLAQKRNITFVERGLKKCVVYLDPGEFRTTWVGNKAIYRTRTAIADGGRLIVLAPGVERFGEDDNADALIRKYGYSGREHILEAFYAPENEDLRANKGIAAHLIHGSPDGRFSVTYATRALSEAEIRGVGFEPGDYDALVRRYDPKKLKPGENVLADGEEVYFIPNPAVGLWINREKFENE